MTYTEELLSKADAVIPRVTLEDFNNDSALSKQYFQKFS